LKIAINAWFGDNPSVGSGQYLKYLLPALLQVDPDLEIILVSPKPFAQQLAAPQLTYHLAATPLPNQFSNLAKVWFEQITFPRVCRQLRVDVAHVPYFGSPLAPTTPTVVTIHDLIPLVLPAYRGNLLVRLYTALVAAAAPRANLILADSEASQRDVRRKLRIPTPRTRVVYLAPASYFSPTSPVERANFRKKYNLPENFVLYLGGYDVRKNVLALLRAYTWVNAALGDSYPLVLAGQLPAKETPFFPNPLRLAREIGIEKSVITPGWIAEEDRPLLYAAATVFVYPSRYEGFGLPVLEAMACGTPVITTQAASLPELVGDAAFQLTPDDTRSLSAAIICLCTDEEFRKEMIERGLRQVKKFSWENTAQQTWQAYQDVYLGKRP
jgi:glycosyltransferase involved in cell wall biosynthesis